MTERGEKAPLHVFRRGRERHEAMMERSKVKLRHSFRAADFHALVKCWMITFPLYYLRFSVSFEGSLILKEEAYKLYLSSYGRVEVEKGSI